MTPPISAVVAVAKSPEQAKIFVALLAGEGIPAHVEGEGLADEFAMSRRLMNLVSVRVMVPTTSLERAREVLAATEISDEELERQAGAEAEPPPPAPTPAAPARRRMWPLVLAITAAIVFFALWMRDVARGLNAEDLVFRYEPLPDGGLQFRRGESSPVARYVDSNGDGSWDRWLSFDANGKEIAVSSDDDHDGFVDRVIEHRESLVVTWIDVDRDRLFDVCEVVDREGRIVQKFAWKAGGYVLEQR